MAGSRVLRRRVERIGTVLPEPKPPVRRVNLAVLTEAEVAEVEALAAICTRDPGGRRFRDRWDLEALSDAELARLEVLVRKVQAQLGR
ncbi:MAG TPA: hypothetical protein VK988_02920 [Acidimicrobiales bacterium]|nr:hypothetical protein [Acidimicrobiales bacterium]